MSTPSSLLDQLASPQDDEAIAALLLATHAAHIRSAADLSSRRRRTLGLGFSYPGEVSTVDGEIVAHATLTIPPGSAVPALDVGLVVHPDFRSVGIGRRHLNALIARARTDSAWRGRELGYLKLTLRAEDPHGLALATSAGFTIAYRTIEYELDLVDWQPQNAVPPPDGIEIVDFERAVELVGIHAIREAINRVSADVHWFPPRQPVDDEDFALNTYRNADFLPRGSFIAIKDGAVLGSTLLSLESPGMGCSGHTGVVREARGLRLAQALKTASINWAIANGLRQLASGNASTNPAIHGVNDALGFTRRAGLTHVTLEIQD